jgi:hypothetical protein
MRPRLPPDEAEEMQLGVSEETCRPEYGGKGGRVGSRTVHVDESQQETEYWAILHRHSMEQCCTSVDWLLLAFGTVTVEACQPFP